ncbi:hypothetical protein [Lacipirellula sp.]
MPEPSSLLIAAVPAGLVIAWSRRLRRRYCENR